MAAQRRYANDAAVRLTADRALPLLSPEEAARRVAQTGPGARIGGPLGGCRCSLRAGARYDRKERSGKAAEQARCLAALAELDRDADRYAPQPSGGWNGRTKSSPPWATRMAVAQVLHFQGTVATHRRASSHRPRRRYEASLAISRQQGEFAMPGRPACSAISASSPGCRVDTMRPAG